VARLTLAEARRLGQSSAHLDADPTYARWVMRRVSPALSAAIVNFTPLSADAVTVLSISSGVLGALALVPGTGAFDLVAVLLLQIAYLCDVADGEVARIRGTAGPRGTYLDLIGHVLQNRALYGAAAYLLIVETGFAPWSIVIGLAAVGLAGAFGEQALRQVLGSAAPPGQPAHGRLTTTSGEPLRIGPGALGWVYRRVAFLWNYPASMNLFCLAALADAGRTIADPASRPLVVPGLFAAFGLTLALKQLANALRLLRASVWSAR
jgi:hypothetical protein